MVTCFLMDVYGACTLDVHNLSHSFQKRINVFVSVWRHPLYFLFIPTREPILNIQRGYLEP